MNRNEAEIIMHRIDVEKQVRRERTVLEAEFEGWRQLNAKSLHCTPKRQAMFLAFEAAWESAFDYALEAGRKKDVDVVYAKDPEPEPEAEVKGEQDHRVGWGDRT